VITIGMWLLHELLRVTLHINTDNLLVGYAPDLARGQWWRLVTPLVVHLGFIHLAFNMVWLYQLGTSLERIMGKVAFALTYVATGIAGEVASALVYHPAVASGGASGAIYGLGGVLVGAYATSRYIDRRRTGPPAPGSLQFNGEAVRSLAIAFGLWLVIGNLVLRVDTAAHAGGAALGLVIGAVLAAVRNGPAVADSNNVSDHS
jgi:rhomboid protease GluP